MDASALLSKQGWRGSGFSLDKSNHGLAKPLLVSRKVDALGLGTKKDDFSNQWWLRAWDTPKAGQAATPPLASAPSHLPHTLNSRISGSRGLYSHFVKADTLWGTIDEMPEVPPTTKRKEAMAEQSEPALVKETKKDGKKRKREEDKSAVEASNTKKSKKDKKEKHNKREKDKHARDLTPSAEDVEDVFFVDTTGSSTKPAPEPTKPVAVARKDKKNEMSEKRSKKLAGKQGRIKAAKSGTKKPKQIHSAQSNDTDSSEEDSSEEADLTKMDTNADFVAIGETLPDSKDISARRFTPNPKLPRSTNKFQMRKAKREGRLDDVTLNDATDPRSTEGKKKKKKAFLRTPEEKAAAEAGRPKVNKAEKYARQKELRRQKRALKAQHMTPEQLAAEEAEKKERKRLKKEKEAQKAADKEQTKLSKNQRKAAKKAAKAE